MNGLVPSRAPALSGEIVPFHVAVPDDTLTDLRERLVRTRWPEAETVSDWSQGVPLEYLRELCRYWSAEYSWRACEKRLNSFPQFRIRIDDVDVHFLHVRSPEPDALPLVLTHGWPGSIVEFLDVIGPLTDPAAYGGDPRDAFHLVIPSLPGFGFSGKPERPGWNRERIADAWAALMARLGYDRFAAQGGDWGASVTNHLALRYPRHLAGIHLNLVSVSPPADQSGFTAQQRASLAAYQERQAHHARWELGYVHQQRTRPQTLGYGLTDSPVGQCAWILEKFKAWSDCADDPIGPFGIDRILDNITVYWLTATATSSARLYWEAQPAGFSTRIDVPTGATIFPKELTRPPRSWAAEVYTDLRYWNEVDRGGHFAAFEQPELFVGELRNCFRLMR
ncbi:epoxide hydrolase family protein [Frankia gtarii]|uniref:epoxide hydrolase family protein n=1 Tax=Frankia gtarii TaxID=2950102 RepID=UPI0021C14365|nr:epoxide hydrolase family protein [Frankia gtarii]